MVFLILFACHWIIGSYWLINICICHLLSIYFVACSVIDLLGKDGSEDEQFLTLQLLEKLGHLEGWHWNCWAVCRFLGFSLQQSCCFLTLGFCWNTVRNCLVEEKRPQQGLSTLTFPNYWVIDVATLNSQCFQFLLIDKECFLLKLWTRYLPRGVAWWLTGVGFGIWSWLKSQVCH